MRGTLIQCNAGFNPDEEILQSFSLLFSFLSSPPLSLHGHRRGRKEQLWRVLALLLRRLAKAHDRAEEALRGAEAMQGEDRPVGSAGMPEVRQEWHGA